MSDQPCFCCGETVPKGEPCNCAYQLCPGKCAPQAQPVPGLPKIGELITVPVPGKKPIVYRAKEVFLHSVKAKVVPGWHNLTGNRTFGADELSCTEGLWSAKK